MQRHAVSLHVIAQLYINSLYRARLLLFYIIILPYVIAMRRSDVISQNNESSPRVLDIGCGVNKTIGAIGMDINLRSAADVIHDLDDLPYPFADNRFDVVIGRHVIEHVHDPMAVMSELHRITRPGGLVKIIAPHWTNPDFATDLTHRNYLSSYSFRNLIEGREVFPFYSEVRFRQRRTCVTLLNLWRPLGF